MPGWAPKWSSRPTWGSTTVRLAIITSQGSCEPAPNLMARLIVKTGSLKEQVLELRMGVNRFGRGTSNDFCIEHPTVSTVHCEMTVTNGHLLLHDCNSTNGTFVHGEPVCEARLAEGESFRIGDIEFYIESLDMNVAIPHFDLPRPAPPV